MWPGHKNVWLGHENVWLGHENVWLGHENVKMPSSQPPNGNLTNAKVTNANLANAKLCCLALIGPRAAGKTTLGQALASRLGWEFRDADSELQRRVGIPAGEYLQRAGEPAFRALETEITLAELARSAKSARPDSVRQVIALGGGAVLAPAIRVALAEPGIGVVLVIATPDRLVARLRASAVGRPPLTSLSLEQEVVALLAARRSLYENAAQLVIDTSEANVDECCRKVLEHWHAMAR